jgi:type IV pilus assembly protein PilB
VRLLRRKKVDIVAREARPEMGPGADPSLLSFVAPVPTAPPGSPVAPIVPVSPAAPVATALANGARPARITIAPPAVTPAPLAVAAGSPTSARVPVRASDAAIHWFWPGTPWQIDPAAASALPSPGTAPIAPRGPPEPSLPTRLGDMLIHAGIVTPEQLDLALAEQIVSGLRLGAQLVQSGTITERQLVETLADQLQVPIVDLRLFVPTPEAVTALPEAVARRFEVVPLRKTPAGLEIAIADILDGHRHDLEEAIGGPIVQVLAPPSEIRYAIDQAYLALAGVEQQVKAFESFESNRPKVESNRLVVDANAPIVQVVMLLLTQAVRDRASDIHIEPKEDMVRVRFRIDGVMRDATHLPESMGDALISRIKVMADMNIVERRRSQDGQIATMIDDRPLDIRVATTATIWGEKAVLRLLDKTRGLRNLRELGMTTAMGDAFRDLATSPFGMVICSGPTGSGKTTTLYAALNEIDSPDRNVTTIEDPVEYVLPSINQIQVNAQAGITFADGLKAILRQDPDVILVGEIRDVETARIAVQSALTGHLVLSSLHATDAVTALQRLRDMGIEPFLITSSVLAIEAQRLVRRICPHCKEPYTPTPPERLFFEQNSDHDKDQFWHGVGCNLCSHTGYSARVGVYELLRMTEPIKKLVMSDAGHDQLRALAIAEGMTTLSDEAMRLINGDVTTIAEAIRSVYVR